METSIPQITQFPNTYPNITFVTKVEFESLRKEVLEMKELLKRAVKYDEQNNQPHCETEEKVVLIKRIAEMVGVSLEDVLGK